MTITATRPRARIQSGEKRAAQLSVENSLKRHGARPGPVVLWGHTEPVPTRILGVLRTAANHACERVLGVPLKSLPDAVSKPGELLVTLLPSEMVERVPHTLQSTLLSMRSRIDRLYERLAEVLETDDPEQVRILTRRIDELEEKEGLLFTQLLESRRLVPADVADAFLRKMAE